MSLTSDVLAKKNMLFRLALRILGNREDAEDALSQVYVKIWANRKKFSQYDNLDKVLYQTLKNQCIDVLRSKKEYLEFDEGVAQTAIYDPAAESENEKFDQVQRIINTLPEKQKMMIHLRMVEGFSMEKIAGIMDEKVNTVEVNISRARKKIRLAYATRVRT